jgi:hypothetical protein
MKKVVKVSLLLIIFGVPVIWYLFLQLFGNNQFDLQVIQPNFLEGDCQAREVTLFYREEIENPTFKNQFNRIKQYAQSKGIKFKPMTDCISNAEYDLYLVDQENQLRGEYTYEILEVDRAEVEIDLLNKINKENGSGN